MTRISVLILTRNEEQNLPGCLESVSWSDDVHVFDSASSDETVQIAERLGASVVQRSYADTDLAFGGDEAAHRNWGIRNIPFRHPWVFQLDADERCTPELAGEMLDATETSEFSAYRVQRRDFLGSTWLKRVQASPYYLRLFRPEKIRYERMINFNAVVDGPVGQLRSHFDHFPFSKGMHNWLAKHNSYSTLEARQLLEDEVSDRGFSLAKAFFARDFHERRYHQKRLFHRLPCRPLLKFLLLYVGKRGFLDGRAGYTYARLQSIYEYFVVLKARELRRQEKLPG